MITEQKLLAALLVGLGCILGPYLAVQICYGSYPQVAIIVGIVAILAALLKGQDRMCVLPLLSIFMVENLIFFRLPSLPPKSPVLWSLSMG